MKRVSPCFFGISDDAKVFEVSYEITNKCNLKCLHCVNNSGEEHESALPTGRIYDLIDDLVGIGMTSIYLTGGEPTLHPDFDAIVSYIKSKNIAMVLATNGTNVKNKIEIIKDTISRVSVSMDGIGEVHDEFRNTPGVFDEMMEVVALLRRNGVPVRVSSMIWKKNAGQIEEMIVRAKEVGVYKIHFSMLVAAGRAAQNIEDIRVPAEDYPALVNIVHGLIDKYSTKDFVVSAIRDHCIDGGSESCQGGARILHINTRGEIFPCSWIGKGVLGKEYGTLWEKGNIRECLKRAGALHDLVEKRIRLSGISGCPAMADGPLGEDPLNKLLGA